MKPRQAKKADCLADLLSRRVHMGLKMFARNIERDILTGPAVSAFVEKVKRDKWRLVVVVDNNRILETRETWRTKREALPLIGVVQDAARAVRALYVKDEPKPLAGWEQAIFSKPISYTAKDKR